MSSESKIEFYSNVFGALLVTRVNHGFDMEGTIDAVNEFRNVPLHITSSKKADLEDVIARAEAIHANFLVKERAIRLLGIAQLPLEEYSVDKIPDVSHQEIADDYSEMSILNYFLDSNEISIYYDPKTGFGQWNNFDMNILTTLDLEKVDAHFDG